MSKDLIGIVGGVGPYAGLDLVRKVFDQTKANSDQEHFSVCLLSESSKIADRTAYLCGKIKENPAHAITDVLKKLYKIGATVAAIACNTAHSPEIFDVVLDNLKKSNTKICIPHIANETADFIKQNFPDISRIGVLGTKGTYDTNLYGSILLSRGFKTINPHIKTQDMVHKAIYDPNYGIKSKSNPITDNAIRAAYQGLRELQSLGAQGVILGCTELPMVIKEKKIEDTLIFDPTLILARALIRAVAPEKLKPCVYDEIL